MPERVIGIGRNGRSAWPESALEEMVRTGALHRLSPEEARQQFKTRGGDVYTVGPQWQ